MSRRNSDKTIGDHVRGDALGIVRGQIGVIGGIYESGANLV